MRAANKRTVELVRPAAPEIGEAAESPFEPLEIGRLAWRQKWLILGITVLGVVAAMLWTLGKNPIYEAKTVLQYDPAPQQPLGRSVEVATPLGNNFWMAREWYQTQNHIITSRALCERVIRSLGLHRDREFMHVSESKTGWKEASIDDAVARLRGAIDVKDVEDTRLVEVTVRDLNPTRAANIANALGESYLKWMEDEHLGSTSRGLDWLNERTKTLGTDLNRAEHDLHDFLTENDVLSVSLEDKQNVITAQLEHFNNELSIARTKRMQLTDTLAVHRTVNLDDPISAHAPLIDGSAAVQHLRTLYSDAVLERDTLAVRFGPNHPQMQEVNSQLENIRVQLRGEIEGVIAALAAELDATIRTEGKLRAAEAEAHAAGLQLNLLEIEYNRLARERENTQKLHSVLLERTAETNLTKRLRVSPVRVVDSAAVPDVAASPRMSVNAAVGLVTGLILGIFAAFIRERADRTIKSPADAEAFGITLLGLLPRISDSDTTQKRGGYYYYRRTRKSKTDAPPAVIENKDLVVHTHPQSSVAECCRTIRTNLSFISPEKELRTLLVTSAHPVEGKTTVAVSMAIALAQSGSRVLLIDTDLRRPRVHRVFGMTLQKGVTSVLVNHCKFADAVQKSDVPLLDVMTAGPIPPNPAELLHTEAFSQFLKRAATEYDRVVLDSPPVGVVTDSSIIAPRVDGVMLVIRAQRTTRDSFTYAKRQLATVGANLLGTILNHIDLSGQRSYAGYYYGKRYYRNASEDEEKPAAAQAS